MIEDEFTLIERERCARIVEAAEPYTLTEVLAERIRKPDPLPFNIEHYQLELLPVEDRRRGEP